MVEAGSEVVSAVRRFNRFYTRTIGVLEEGLLGSDLSLTEVRVLYELAHASEVTATDLRKQLGVDAGYLSRILKRFESKKLVAKRANRTDARQQLLTLTPRGRATFAPLDARSQAHAAALVEALTDPARARLVAAMATIEHLLGSRPQRRPPYLLRAHRPGDMGWVVHRHGVLYAEEYGWDERFEALVASIVAEFIHRFDPRREHCWLAEIDGDIVGSVFLVAQSKTVAKLRLLLVEPKARGLGIGNRLVEECIRFARHARYRRLLLWTNSVLTDARRIYERAGFRLVREEPHQSFGHDLVAQTWQLDL